MYKKDIYYIFVEEVIDAWKIIISGVFWNLLVFFLTEKAV